MKMKARTKMKTLLLLGVLLFGFTVSAQSQKVSLDFKNERVEKVLASIKSQTGMSLVFSDQLVDVNRKVTMQLKDVTLKEALTRLLSGTDLTFEIRNNKIYFIEKKAVSQPGSKKKRVTGVVKDVMGEPLIGANVVEKGRSTNGVITDFNGKFTLEVDESASLVVSYIGYLAQDIPTKGKGDFHIVLKEDANTLDEVVVTGYGDFKKATYTGSASVLTTEKLEALPVVSVGQMIESNIPGISVVAGTSSQPGAKTTLRVRGIASMNASTEPLYVLDGVPIPSYDLSNFTSMSEAGGMGVIETLNPADIESITVLKDAASASLYGAKGANGVVLITTKKGKEGKLRVNMAAKYGITDFAYTYRPLMGGEERRELIHEGLVNFQLDKGVSEQEAQQYADANIDQYAKRLSQGYSDWESALFKKGYQQDYNLSASAGNQNSSFIGSLGYTKQTGVSLNSEMERFTGRVDASNKYKKVEFGMNASFSWTKNVHLPEGKFYGSAIYASKVNLTPSTPIYNEDGTYASGYRENNGYNPVLEAEVNDYYARTVRAMGTAKIAYNVWDNLKISSVFTVDYSLTKDFFFQSPEGRDGATYQGRGRMQMTDRMIVDGNRVGIMGWSHGGMITLMNLFNYPGQYKCGFAGVPVSDVIMRMGYASDSYRKIFSAKNHIGQTAKDNIAEYKRRSPVWHAEKLKDPLLIYTNTSDDDVNVIEVESMIRALKAEGKKFEYKIFERAPGAHSFDRLDTYESSKIRLDIYKFMGRYLKPNKPFGSVKELRKAAYKF